MALANAGRRFQDARSKLDTVNEYNKAIQHLKAHVRADGSPSSLRIALIACMLFIALELTTERFEEAIIHLNEGRKMLRSSSLFSSEPDGARTLILAPNPESVEDELVGIFADLDLQYTYFGSERPRLSLSPHKCGQIESPEAQYSMVFPNTFSSIGEANQYLVIATNKCLQFVGWKIQPERHSLRNELHSLQRQSLCEGLEAWKVIYDRFYAQVGAAKEKWSWQQQSELMLIQHTWLSILVPNSYSEAEETIFDSYMQEFAEITDRAANVLLQKAKAPGRFTLEFGLVAPLTWTTLRCRHPQIRRRALSLVEKTPREGLWDPKLVARLSRELISLEEGIDDLNCPSAEWHKGKDLTEVVPLEQRFNDTTMDFENNAECPMLRMGFQRRTRSGDGKVIGIEEIVRRYPVQGQPMMHSLDTKSEVGCAMGHHREGFPLS